MGPWTFYADGKLSGQTEYMQLFGANAYTLFARGASRVQVRNVYGEVVLDSMNGDFAEERERGSAHHVRKLEAVMDRELAAEQRAEERHTGYVTGSVAATMAGDPHLLDDTGLADDHEAAGRVALQRVVERHGLAEAIRRLSLTPVTVTTTRDGDHEVIRIEQTLMVRADADDDTPF